MQFAQGRKRKLSLSRDNLDAIARAAHFAVETLESRVLLSVNVTSYHYDQAETGANTKETILTPSNVNVDTFGKVASLPVDGQIYAQPLVMTGVSVPGQGTQDLVFVVTEMDSVYAFNAEGTSTTPVWHTSLLQTGETPISSSVTSTNIDPWYGITGTPVIDPATGTLYCVGCFTTPSNTYQQRLYAINIATGAVVDGGPVIIAATVAGSGAGSSGGSLAFDTILELQRPALTLDNGQIYVAFASHNDQGNYHGWVFAYNETTLAEDYVWCDTPNGSEGGIWMSGGGLAVDSSGDLYLTSGNGSFDANTGGKDYGMALVKLTPALVVLDYFSPYNEATLSNGDEDYGCGNAVLLPTQTGSAPNESLTLGKWGGIYLNNTTTGDMGEINNPPNGPNKDLAEASTGDQQHNTFSYWNGNVYIGVDGGTLRDYAVGGGTLATTFSSQSSHSFVYGTSPTISSNGTSDGIVWAIENNEGESVPAILYAYNPSNLAQVYWSSNQAANGRDTCGDGVKFTTPVVANGFVYVGGASSVTLYSNIPYSPQPPPPAPPPPAPVGAISGFGKFTLNAGGANPTGVPAISTDSNTLTMTTNVGTESSSAVYDTPVGYQNFTAQFTYTDTQGSPPADGITFMLEDDSRGVNAIGGSGGSLGYTGITPSFAAEFNVYEGSSIADGTNGTVNIVHNDSNTGSVDLTSGDPINVILSYNSSSQTLTETLTDQVANDIYTTSYTGINLSNILGSGTAYMGFTGGTGGAESLQTITNFAYYVTPLWLTSASAASWNASTGTLTVTGAATIIADPGSDLPNIVASGSAAKLTIAPTTSPSDIHIGGITLTDGASIVMSDVDASQVADGANAADHHSDHNVLIIGALGAANDPTLSIDSTSKLDLGDNDLIVHTGSSDTGTTDVQGYKETSELKAVEALAATGRNVAAGGIYNGTWTGDGLTSSAAATADSDAGYEQNILAVEQNSDMYLGGYSTWTVGSASETLGANDIIVKYTYNGDLNLDGAVDGNAATIFSTFYGSGASGNTYAYGDLNGDRKINGNDATIFSTVYGNGLAGSGLPHL